jgi:hypothetical protein
MCRIKTRPKISFDISLIVSSPHKGKLEELQIGTEETFVLKGHKIFERLSNTAKMPRR